MLRRRPERCSRAGVWMAPPQTTTCAEVDRAGLAVGPVTAARMALRPVEHEAVDPVAGQQAGAGGRGAGEIGLGHALPRDRNGRRPRRGRSSSGGSRRGASRGRPRPAAAPRWPGSAAPGTVCTDSSRSTSSQMRKSSSASKSTSWRSRRQRSSDRLGRPPVEAAVDLGAPAGAATLRVGDGGEAERRGHPAGPVLPVHLLEGEGHHLALADHLALFEHEHVEAGLGQQRSGRGAAGAGPHDEDVGVELHRDAPAWLGAPSGSVSGHVSQT